MASRSRTLRRGTISVAAYTVGGVLSCLVVATSIVAVTFWSADDENFTRAMLCAIAIPIILGAPWFLVLSLKWGQLARVNKALLQAAQRDSMTGLLNWSAFHQVVRDANGCGGALLLIDVDHFKAVNDVWGHQAGDAMLRHVAQTLAQGVGQQGVVGRLGGEEFGVFLPVADAAAAAAVAEALRATVAASRTISDETAGIALTVSIGAVAYAGTTSHDDAMRHTDLLLYRAKANGRDRVEFGHLASPAAIVEVHGKAA